MLKTPGFLGARAPEVGAGEPFFRLGFLARAVVPRCDHIMNYLARSSTVRVTLQEKATAMDDLTPGQEEAVAATVGAIQRIAMAVVELPTEGRAAHYAMVRRNFEAALMEVGIEGATAHAWLNNMMHGIESLVSEIEAGGGAAGGKA